MAEETKKSGKKRWIVLVTVLLLLILLLRYLPTNLLPPDEDSFTLTATDVPDTVKVGETVTVEATLSCSPFRSFWAVSGLSTVEVLLYPEGVDTGSIAVARTHYLPAGGHKTAAQTLTPEEPGRYILQVTAHFSVGETKYTFALPEKTVTVTE